MTTSQEYVGRVSTDQSVSSSTTLVDITGMVQPVTASSIWGFNAFIQFNLAGVISGQKFGLAAPSSPTNFLYTIEILNGTGLSISAIGLSSSTGGALATTGLHIARISGVLENGANAGNLSIQFAQNTSDSSAITIKRGSLIRCWNMG